MTSYKSIFGGNLERVKPMPKIMSVSLALFFAFFATHAVAGDDNDCVSIPNDAGFPYAGQTHCCNRVESNLPAGAHNAKYGDVIPWNRYEGTVLKCLGGYLHDDKWGDPFVSIVEDETKIPDVVARYKFAAYQKFDGYVWRYAQSTVKRGGIQSPNIFYFTNYAKIPGTGDWGIWDYEPTELDYLKEVYDLTGFIDLTGRLYYKNEKQDDGRYRIELYFGGFMGVHNISLCANGDFKVYVEPKIIPSYGDSVDYWKVLKFISANYREVGSCYDVDSAIDDVAATASEEKTSIETEPKSSESVIQYGYQQCSSNSDCTREKLSEFLNGNPYLHSTDWYCIEQTSGNHVCAAKACEDEYEIKTINGNPQGYCIKKTAPVAAAGQTPPAGQQQKQSDNNSGKSTVTSEQKQQSSDAERIKQLTATVDSAYASLQTLTKNLSVWKNTEGNFNTARLVSDSAAGVVLGTVGGVVTATLVKKNQIKKGFESIQCTVGGQTIGGYGDQIKIGR